MNKMTALKSLLFLIAAPGIVAGFVPLGLLLIGPQVRTGLFSYLAFPMWVIGLAGLLWCFWDFVQKGKGTPAPIDPPKKLVASGLYRYVRNPMYVSVFIILIGHFLWFGYWWLLAYAGLLFVPVHLFVTLYEEPDLKKRFGAAYGKYLSEVPRWLPRFR
jgi:protein-S-isoprenylcysteine O-methyltransferase Ste14